MLMSYSAQRPGRHFRCTHRIRSPPGRRCLTSRIWCRQAGSVLLELARADRSFADDQRARGATRRADQSWVGCGRRADHDHRRHDVRRGQIDDADVFAGGTRRSSTRCPRPQQSGSYCASSASARQPGSPRRPAGSDHAAAPRGLWLAPTTDLCESTRCCAPSTAPEQGASFGHAEVAGRACRARGCSADMSRGPAESRAGDRRGMTTRRQDRLPARRRPPAQAGDHRRRAIDPDATLMARGD